LRIADSDRDDAPASDSAVPFGFGTRLATWLKSKAPHLVITRCIDISRSQVVPGAGPSHFGVAAEFTAAGAERMRRATSSHLGGPLAILVNGDVVAVILVKAPLSTSAVIGGDYTRADAERLASGIGIR
jgi:preprotein translocase subunit SecD